MFHYMLIFRIFADVGMVFREVWWMGWCLFQGTGGCGVWIVDDLCLFSSFLCLVPTLHPPKHSWNFSVHLYYTEPHGWWMYHKINTQLYRLCRSRSGSPQLLHSAQTIVLYISTPTGIQNQLKNIPAYLSEDTWHPNKFTRS